MTTPVSPQYSTASPQYGGWTIKENDVMARIKCDRAAASKALEMGYNEKLGYSVQGAVEWLKATDGHTQTEWEDEVMRITTCDRDSARSGLLLAVDVKGAVAWLMYIEERGQRLEREHKESVAKKRMSKKKRAAAEALKE
jgi:hypothetical protein